jgi:hypothetical protein
MRNLEKKQKATRILKISGMMKISKGLCVNEIEKKARGENVNDNGFRGKDLITIY